MRGFKSILSLFLTFCMIMCMLPATLTLVSAAAYTVKGDTIIYAPPSGKRAAVTYTLVNGAGEEVTDAVIKISKAGDEEIPNGLFYSADKNNLVIDGSEIEAGSFTLAMTSAADETVTAQKTVTVSDVRIFSDFDDLVAYDGEGNETNFQMSDIKVPFPKLSGGEYTPVDSHDAGWMTGYAKGGKALGIKDSNGSYPVIYAGNLTNRLGGRPTVATVELDIEVSKSTGNSRFGESSVDWAIGWTQDSNLTVGDGSTVTELKVKPNEMNRCHVIVDYNNHTYTPGVDGVTGTTAYAMTQKNTGYNYLYRLKSYSTIDNFAIYSGKPFPLTAEVCPIGTIDGVLALITADMISDESLDALTTIKSPLTGMVSFEGEEYVLSWSSSNSQVIDVATGTVNQGSEKHSVTVTASFDILGHTFEKAFGITVPAITVEGTDPDEGEPNPNPGENSNPGENPDAGEDEPEAVIPNPGDTYELSGDTILYAPPKGKRSVITYNLVNKSQEKVVHDGIVSVHSLAGASIPKGVFYTEGKNKIVLDGNLAESGNFIVRVTSASYPEMTAELEVGVENNRFFWDFDDAEDGVQGTDVSTTAQHPITRLDGTAYTPGVWHKGYVKNHIMMNSISMYMHNVLATPEKARQHLTVDVSISVSGGKLSEGLVTSKRALVVGWTNDGKLTLQGAETDVSVNLAEWNDLCLALDYEKHSVIPTVNGVRSEKAYPFDSAQSAEKEYSALRVLTSYVPLDNIAIYSGEPLPEDAYVYLPEAGSILPEYDVSALGTNYAVNKAASFTAAGDSYVPYTPAEFLTDGVIFDGSDVLWLGESGASAVVDFGASYPVDRIALYQYGKNLGEFSLYRSDNGNDWRELSVSDVNNIGNGEGRTPYITEAVFPLDFARYIKLEAKETTGIVMLSELAAYCSVPYATLGNLITNSDITDESLDGVTGNIFELKNSVSHEGLSATIEWESDKPTLLNPQTRVVVQGSTAENVRLTAKFNVNNGESFEKVFNIKILPDVFGAAHTVRELESTDYTEGKYEWAEENGFAVTEIFIVEFKVADAVLDLGSKTVTIAKDGEETVFSLDGKELLRTELSGDAKCKFEISDDTLQLYIDKNNTMGYRLMSFDNEAADVHFAGITFSEAAQTVKLCVPEEGLIDIVLNQFDYAKLSNDPELNLASDIKIIDEAMGVTFSYHSSENGAINENTGAVDTSKPGIYDFTVIGAYGGEIKDKTFRPVIGNIASACPVGATSAAYGGSATESITETERGRSYLATRESYSITVSFPEEKVFSKLLINEADSVLGNISGINIYAIDAEGTQTHIGTTGAVGAESIINTGIVSAQKIRLDITRKSDCTVSGISKLMAFFAPSAADRVQKDKEEVSIPANIGAAIDLKATGSYGSAITYSSTNDKITILPKEGGGYTLSVNQPDYDEPADITATVRYGESSDTVMVRVTLTGKNTVSGTLPDDSGFGGGLNAGGGGIGSGSIGGSGGSSGSKDENKGNDTQTPEKENYLAEIENHWAKTEIAQLITDGIVKGDGNSLNLDSAVTRAEFLAMIIRGGKFKLSSYSNAFADVKAEDWFAEYMQTGYDKNILRGDGLNANPNASITRQEAALMLSNLFADTEDDECSFTDKAYISEWAAKGVLKAAALGLIKGYEDGSFAPHKNIRRDEAMVVICRYMQLSEEKEAE